METNTSSIADTMYLFIFVAYFPFVSHRFDGLYGECARDKVSLVPISNW